MEEIKGLRKYELPPLPYKIDALEPYISKDIVDVHYNGHHKGYVNTANTLIDRLNGIINEEVKSYDIHGVLRNLTFNINGDKLHTLYRKLKDFLSFSMSSIMCVPVIMCWAENPPTCSISPNSPSTVMPFLSFMSCTGIEVSFLLSSFLLLPFSAIESSK